MMHSELSNLIDRISTEPSVLFLGQDYLGSLTGQNPFLELATNNYCHGETDPITNYFDLWDKANSGEPLNEEVFQELSSIASQISDQMWLRSILAMKWGIVYTSAIDSCLVNRVGENFSIELIRKEKKLFKREYLSKRLLHGVCLFGDISDPDDYPPVDCNKQTLGGLKRRYIAGKIEWIYREVLSNYGILVIDGWNPQSDWLDYLLEPADRMPLPNNSIYLFGATSDMKSDSTISELVDSGIVKVYDQTFAQALQEYGYFDSDDEDSHRYISGISTTGKSITVRRRDGKYSFLTVPLPAVDILDGQITLLDDEIGTKVPGMDADTRSEFFAKYLQQAGVPNWALCGAQAGFHFERDADSILYDEVERQVKEKSSKRNVIVLEGFSNSGKTSCLTYLAMRLRDAHQMPVIYISGMPTQRDYEEKLKSFIKQYLVNPETDIDNIIVIWDGNKDSDAVRNYERLARVLSECNVLVIGTMYRSELGTVIDVKQHNRGVKYIHIDARLSAQEEKNLITLLGEVDNSLLARYQEIISQPSKTNLFSILHRICMFRYSPEWRIVKESLEGRFYKEVEYAEDQSREGYIEFQRKQEELVHDEIMRLGVGAAWQIKLLAYKERLHEAEQHNPNADIVISSEAEGQLSRLNKAAEDIQRINALLALAGQFGVELPVTLLLHTINNQGELLSQENMFLNDVMEKDSLVEYTRDDQGYPYVKFRDANEAQQYIIKNFGEDIQERKRKEIDYLCSLIQSCAWDSEEAFDVIKLVRCFGTNSNGKIGTTTLKRSYNEYIEFFPRIAEELMEYADNNPEAILVYAHFLRDKYDYDRKQGSTGNNDYLKLALEKLYEAIEIQAIGDQQYNRLIVEICSNLNASMRWSQKPFSREIYRSFVKHFAEAVTTWREDSFNSYFTTNSLLDIWLNGIENFRKSFDSDDDAINDKEFSDNVAESLNYISRLFNASDDAISTNLLDKMDNVFRWVSSDKMIEISKNLEVANNDTYLYMTAWRCWITDIRGQKASGTIGILRRNLYALPDDADSWQEISGSIEELRQKAIKAARDAVIVLESNYNLIEKSKSIRCLDMLIKSKWLCYTGHMPLEEKQLPQLTFQQWKDLDRLWSISINYCKAQNASPQPFALFLHAIYLWVYDNNPKGAKDIFKQVERLLKPGRWYIERIGLCKTGTNEQRVFYVEIIKGPYDNYTAQIWKENGEDEYSTIKGMKGIYIPKNVSVYLLDNQELHEQRRITKPVVIWFNAAGPILGVPYKGGE